MDSHTDIDIDDSAAAKRTVRLDTQELAGGDIPGGAADDRQVTDDADLIEPQTSEKTVDSAIAAPIRVPAKSPVQPARRAGSPKRLLMIGGGVVVAAAVVVGVIFLQDSGDSTVGQAPPTVAPTSAALVAPSLLALGESAQLTFPGGSVVSVTPGVAQWFSDGDPAPEAGEQYLVFDYDMSWVSGPPVDIMPSQLTVRWLNSNTPNTGPSGVDGGHVDSPAQFGPVGPSSSVEGQVAFTLPATETVVLRLADAQGAVLARWTVPAPTA